MGLFDGLLGDAKGLFDEVAQPLQDLKQDLGDSFGGITDSVTDLKSTAQDAISNTDVPGTDIDQAIKDVAGIEKQ